MRPALKWVLLVTISLSLFAALFDLFLPRAGLPRPLELLSLSYWGLFHGYFWQFFTHFLLYPSGEGLSFYFIINLIFTLYMIWAVGNLLIQAKGSRDFLWLYIGGGLVSGMVGAAVIWLAHLPMHLAGTSAALYALMTALVMLAPHAQVYLFFAIPLPIRWLILGMIGIHFLVDLSHGQFLSCAAFMSAVVYAYCFCLLRWKTYSPFTFLRFFERWVIERRRDSPVSKIYDIKTGMAILDDESFIAMCQRKKRLTLKDRFRLWKIRRK